MDLQHHNTIPSHIYDKLNEEEQKYISNAIYISKWFNMIKSGNDYDYIRWASDDDIKIMSKLFS